MEDDITIMCPNCQCSLGIDASGDAYIEAPAALPEGVNTGLGNLQVKEASPDWKKIAYSFGQANGGQRGPRQLQPPSIAGSNNQMKLQPPVDEKLQEALDNDLSNRNIKLKPNNDKQK